MNLWLQNLLGPHVTYASWFNSKLFYGAIPFRRLLKNKITNKKSFNVQTPIRKSRFSLLYFFSTRSTIFLFEVRFYIRIVSITENINQKILVSRNHPAKEMLQSVTSEVSRLSLIQSMRYQYNRSHSYFCWKLTQVYICKHYWINHHFARYGFDYFC